MKPAVPELAALTAATGLDEAQAVAALRWLAQSGAELPAALHELLRAPGPEALHQTTEISLGATFVLEPSAQPGRDGIAPPAELPAEDASATTRYDDLGLLGRGGAGEVRRVYDRHLGRTVAMKVLRPDAAADPRRFMAEARTIAGLQHPGVLPVHELGRLPDGRVYFTMQEIRGRTLRAHVKEVHAASPSDQWAASDRGGSLRRLLDTFHTVCETVAYAHGEGVVHRDLKPRNVMVGEHGEVLVLDWGLSLPAGTPIPGGQVVGTPAYLAPELLGAPTPSVDPRVDVYALGGILFNLLTNRAPFSGPDAETVLDAVRQGPSPVPESNRPLPADLVELCVRCLSRSPVGRPPDARLVALSVRTWLDGARKREQALAQVGRARALMPEATVLRDEAAALEAHARDVLAGLPPQAPEVDKHSAWAWLDDARDLRVRAQAQESEAELILQSALATDPSLPDTHAELAARSMERHATAERQADDAAAAASLIRLQRHLDALPFHHPQRSRLRRYLRGDGAVTLRTDPPGAEVHLHRVVEHHRRLVTEPAGVLGTTPLDAEPVGHGAWILELRHPDRAPVRYPLRVARGEHCTCVGPGDQGSVVVSLPLPDALAADDCYVPAGWTWVGGDPVAFGSAVRRRLWVDGFVMKRFPVTNRQYIAFLDDLVAQGREAEALRHAPRERGGRLGKVGPLIYGRDGAGGFEVRPDNDGDLWRLEEPVMMVDWHGARAFAAWHAVRTGQPWRLPSEWEWEKSARGVDERPYPWGRVYDPSRACTRLSHSTSPEPADIDSYPVDESVYGVRGLGGNVRDWCLDPWNEVPPADGSRLLVPTPGGPTGGDLDASPRSNRGGFWLGNERDARSADRHFHLPVHRAAELSFRLARSFPG